MRKGLNSQAVPFIMPSPQNRGAVGLSVASAHDRTLRGDYIQPPQDSRKGYPKAETVATSPLVRWTSSLKSN